MAHRIVIRRYSPLPGADWSSCIYCGEPAEHIDHVLPVRYSNWRDVLTPEEREQLATVPACGECNMLAGSKAFHSLGDKRDFIRGKLRKRYAKILDGPIWTDEEMAELGDGLRGYVEGTQARRRIIVWRLGHDGFPPGAAEANPILDERIECDLCGEVDWCSSADLDGVLVLACEPCISSAVEPDEPRIA